MSSIDNNTVQIGTQHTQEIQDAVGQSHENAGGDGVTPDLAAQMSRLQLHRPIDFRQDSMSSRAYPSRTVIGFETHPVSYLLQAESYKWLLTKLRSEIILMSPGQKTIETIRQSITDHILMKRKKENFMSKIHS